MGFGIRDQLEELLAGAYDIEREREIAGPVQVFVAVERSGGRRVVIKAQMTSGLSPEKFQREISLISSIPHPQILPVLDSFAREDFFYYIAPLTKGDTLRQRLQRGAIPIDQALHLLGELTNVMAFSHERGIAHRDLRPENIIFEDGKVILADFGIFRALVRSVKDEPATEVREGSGAYFARRASGISGEPVSRSKEIDAHLLGVVAFEMLAGRSPFIRVSKDVIQVHGENVPRNIMHLAPQTPAPVAQWIMDAVSIHSVKRPPKLAELAEALRAR